MKIAIVQSQIPHYREEFFEKFKAQTGADLYFYDAPGKSLRGGFHLGHVNAIKIPALIWHGKIVCYHSWPIIRRHDVLILPLHFGHITTWLILFFKWMLHTKVILWGHGISVRRYLQEEHHPDRKLKWMISLSDGIYVYMEKEAEQWRKIFPNKPIVALHNTVSGIDAMIAYSEQYRDQKNVLKEKHCITQEIVLMICTRFEGNIRRMDLFEAVINSLDANRFGFVVIGAGKDKPDFSSYPNVYDFGAVYDAEVKRELFTLSDIYFQPGWVGLSIVEAMGYGLPIFTFKRSEDIYQCVEYDYIKSGVNGMIFSSVDECVSYIQNMSLTELKRMGEVAGDLIKHDVSVDGMVQRALSILPMLNGVPN
jgi:hypothetical protein